MRSGLICEESLKRVIAKSSFIIIGFVVCPCHLPLTLSLILAVLGGTAFGAFIAQNTYVLYLFFGAWFLGSLWMANMWWQKFSTRKQGAACPIDDPDTEERSSGASPVLASPHKSYAFLRHVGRRMAFLKVVYLLFGSRRPYPTAPDESKTKTAGRA